MKKIAIASFILFSIIGCEEEVTEPDQNLEVVAINNREYFSYVNMRIENAASSIHIIMYYMLYDEENPNYAVNFLLDKLVEAHQRGIEIKVLLDDDDANVDAKNYLYNSGIDVRFDSDDVKTHSKLLIIDGRSIIIGSTNWTESAFNINNETSIEIMDENIANTYLIYFNELWQ